VNVRHTAKTPRPVAALMFRLPAMIDCVQFEEFIVNYLDGTLPARQKFVFNVHLKLCRECRKYLEEYKTAIALAGLQHDVPFSQMELGPVPEDLIKAVIAAQKKRLCHVNSDELNMPT
jgi:predicted anti-sigma-YlaC factor YlaD